MTKEKTAGRVVAMSRTPRWQLVIIFIVLIFLAVSVSAVCLWLDGSRPMVLFLQDSTYADINWPHTRRSFVRTVRKAGYSCVAITYDDEAIGTPVRLLSATQALILEHEPDIVIFSPLISFALDFSESTYDQFVRADGASPLLCGTGGVLDGEELFDVVFSPSPGAGWDSAARALAENEGETPLMTSLLYTKGDDDGEAALIHFQEAFPENRLLVEAQEKTSGTRWAASVLNDLSQYSVMQVATPSVERFDAFFAEEGAGLSWTVDARFSSVVPDKALSGIVADDLGATIEPLLADESPVGLSPAHRGLALSLPLVRAYQPVKTGWRSLF